MADAGWEVTVLSSPAGGARHITAAKHSGVVHNSTPTRRGNAIRPLEFATYVSTAVQIALSERFQVIYASDPPAALPALLASPTGAEVVYHEHDSPNDRSGNEHLDARSRCDRTQIAFGRHSQR